MHPVVGRAYADPARMKPDPAPVLAAMRELNAEPGECVLIGDSISDLTAARRAGVAAIAFANKPGKAERLADAAVVVPGMDRIVAAIEQRYEHRPTPRVS
ncbi:hypothetical protein JCM9533A_53910 [Catenuloplanes niger JCM 9533]|uniref:Beta-phosphoglucomutase-like phosphatase (HAD superfamily) n=1 Tax=Catenuloplanes niger TaxID=587534 RepID=A0AAE3ZPN1_9ACTN|nr:beta-phosphoglucomutase-like phosphatase (HAD superfamily) [Catenuloplanes niger]